MNTKERNTAIVAAKAAGETYKQIGARYGISPTYAVKIVREYRHREKERRRVPNKFERIVGRNFVEAIAQMNHIGYLDVTKKHILSAALNITQLYLASRCDQKSMGRFLSDVERIK